MKNVEFFDFFKTLFFVSRKHSLLTRTMRKTFLSSYLAEQKFKMAIFFDKNHGLIPLKIVELFLLSKNFFFLSRKHSLLSKIMRSRLICLILRRKTKVEKAIFGRKPWTNPFGKFFFFYFFKTYFSLSKKHSFLSRIMPSSFFLSCFSEKKQKCKMVIV